MGKFGCGECLKKFSEFDGLEAHMVEKHSYCENNNKAEEVVEVEKTQISAGHVNDPKSLSEGDKAKYKVPKKFEDRGKETKFICNICEFKSSSKGNLKHHVMNIHENQKPFQCEECEYKSSEKCDLKQHVMAVHEQIKPFKCDQCEYKCSVKHDQNGKAT